MRNFNYLLYALKQKISLVVFSVVLFVVTSCSTTRVLKEGEYRLARAEAKVVNDKDFNESDLQYYIKQRPNSNFIFGWSPGLNIYNWQNGKGKAWDKLVTKIGSAPVVYDPELVDKSIENISRHLTYLGYYDSKVESRIKVRKKKVYVDYIVELGKRYTISELNYNLPKRGKFSAEYQVVMENSLFKVGDYLSESILEKESIRAAEEMRNKGFYDFNKNFFFFEADTLAGGQNAKLDVSINEYTRNETEKEAKLLSQYYINNVSIKYPNSLNIREKILNELCTIRPGDLYSATAINNTYSRLTSLRMFSSVNIGMNVVDTNKVDCNIQLIQSKLQGFKVNAEASVNSSGLFGISPQLSYYHKNIFHGGEWLNLSFMGNFQFKFKDSVRSNEFGVSGSLSLPKFVFLPYRFFKKSIPRTDINLSYNYQSRPEYTRNIISTSFGYNGNVNNKFFYQAYPIQLNIVHLNDVDNKFIEGLEKDPFLLNAYKDHFDLGAGGTFYYTTNPDVSPKTSYSYVRLQTDIAGNLLSAFKSVLPKDENGFGTIWDTPFSQFVRAELTLGRTWRFGKRESHALATRFVAGAGWAYGNSNALPFEKHFYAGGSNSMRGWQSRGLGPGLSAKDVTFVIPNQTGDMKLEANVEYRFPLFWKFAGATFVDAGNIWTINKNSDERSRFRFSTLGKSIALNWGVGLRLDFDFLLLRIDWGMRLHDPALEDGKRWLKPVDWFAKDGYAFHFGVGYPF